MTQADTRQGLTGGFSTTLFGLGPLSVGPELHYVQKGSDLTQLNSEAMESFQEFGLDYVEVPVMLRLGAPLPFGDGGLRGYAEGGFVTLDGRLVRGLTRLEAGEDGFQVRNRALSFTLGYDLGAFR